MNRTDISSISDSISAEELESFASLAAQFDKRAVQPLFEGEYPDGNLEMLPEVLKTAFETGLAASCAEDSPGRDLGIWGASLDDYGAWPSIMLLGIIAETCGGIALCLHAQGAASNLLINAAETPDIPLTRAAMAFQEGQSPFYPGTIMAPAENLPAAVMTVAEEKGNEYLINGTKNFVYSMPDPDIYVVPALCGNRWACFAVPADAKGIRVADAGWRTGVRACSISHIEMNSLKIPANHRIDNGNARDLVIRALTLNWLGISAVAAGIARGAVASAKAYASERYQGCSMIEEHPAVKSLLGSSEARSFTADMALRSAGIRDFSSAAAVKSCAMIKLTLTELCSQAVTDSLQCFGGYGYMEDFGMEKRLRDISVIKSAAGSPFYLKQFISGIEKAGGAG